MSVVAVIPARMGSKRLPAKVVADIGGVPLFVHVAHRVMSAERVDRVIVATDSQRVVDLAGRHGLTVYRSQEVHRTGSDRVAEAVRELDADLVLNVQADNAFLGPSIVDAVVRCFDDPAVQVATPICPFPDHFDSEDPSKVKVVVREDGQASCFSRHAVPHGGPWWLHIGVYGFRPEALRCFAGWARGPDESAEDLEQLRFIENDVAIHVTQVAYSGVSIDTPADLDHLPPLSVLSASTNSTRF